MRTLHSEDVDVTTSPKQMISFSNDRDVLRESRIEEEEGEEDQAEESYFLPAPPPRILNRTNRRIPPRRFSPSDYD